MVKFALRDFSDAELISDWQEFRRGEPKASALIVASRNETVARLNRAARAQLKEQGVLKDGNSFVRKDGTTIELAVNDTIVFTASDKANGIFNSDLARIRSIQGTKISALRSDGEFVFFDLREFAQVAHGYAVTAHRAQGTTVDRAFVYADGAFMDREKAYVALTRGRAGNRLYADRASFGSLSWQQQVEVRKLSRADREQFLTAEYRDRLCARLGTSREKETTLTYRADDINARTHGRFEQAMAKLQAAFTAGLRGDGRENVRPRDSGVGVEK